MVHITTITLLFLHYLAAKRVVKYTTIGQYDWWHKLCNKYQIFDYMRYWKGLYCIACQSFWISMLFSALVGIEPTLSLIIAFIVYSINKEEDIEALNNLKDNDYESTKGQ